MKCTIEWNGLTLSEWQARFNTIRRSNLLQSYAYAQSARALHNQTPRWGVIRIDGQEAGLVQILEVGLFKKAIHALMLDRGPLWFDGFGNEEHVGAFFSVFDREFPNRLGRKRRIIPESEKNFETAGYTKTGKGYETLWLDLSQDEQTLRANLKKNWRGALNKAEKQGMEIEWDDTGEHFEWFMQNYATDKEAKGYAGPSVKLIKSLAKHTIPQRDMMIGRTILDGKTNAGILIIRHGRAATYQLGFSNKAGRDANAHHILLWCALSQLKKMGVSDFDLGGVNDETAKGIKQFKTGMGAQPFKIQGIYA